MTESHIPYSWIPNKRVDLEEVFRIHELLKNFHWCFNYYLLQHLTSHLFRLFFYWGSSVLMLWDIFSSVLNYIFISEILGKNFQLGSFAVNTVFPGGTVMVFAFKLCLLFAQYMLYALQNPHVDYPYWDLANHPENWPGIMKSKPNSDFPLFLNMQVQ